MTDSKMPERIWAGDYSDTDGGGYWWLDPDANTGLAEYIRADLARTVQPVGVRVPDGLIEALRSGRQADADGCMVVVSRQACEEAADILSALLPEGGT